MQSEIIQLGDVAIFSTAEKELLASGFEKWLRQKVFFISSKEKRLLKRMEREIPRHLSMNEINIQRREWKD